MNKIMFDILLYLDEKNQWNNREMARRIYKPYSVVDVEMENLKNVGYVDSNYQITSYGYQYLKEHQIENAIILAAGVSSRFVPLCFERPKGLLPVKGEILIERQIRQLQERGITNITIVVGFMKEKFMYLQEKYSVDIVETTEYKIRNNHASVWAARHKLRNTIVTSSDLYFTQNIFQKYAYDAYYCSVYKEGWTDERGIDLDAYDRILKTSYDVSDTWVTLGYAYFNERFSENFLKILSGVYDQPDTKQKFWADIQDEHMQDLYMYAKKIDNNIVYEFDCLQDLREFDKQYCTCSGSELLKDIARQLETNEGSLTQFTPITKEDLSKGFTFTFQKKKYICKINDKLDVTEINRFDDKVQELINITDSFSTYYESTLPLCAAENVISDFGNMPLSMGFQERYIVGNTYSYLESDNFIGSTYLLPFYEMISDQCQKIFGAKYTDSRTLTGMNCLMIVLMSLAEIGDSILILGSASGGHASVKPICERLGLRVREVPYDYENFDLDYERLNRMIREEKIDYILLAPSDIFTPLHVEKISLGETVLLYDVSQLLGLIGAKVIDNPLDKVDNLVMFGGTHKTFPGPASGIIMTNNESLHSRLETTINPIYIRHTQMHQKASLLFSLVEFENFGQAYEEHIVVLANELGRKIKELGLDVANKNGRFSNTHQVFIRTDKETMERIFNNAVKYGITLNKKSKKLFSGYGIRLGTQEIARYNWPLETMQTVAQIIYLISQECIDEKELKGLLKSLPEKQIQFTFDDNVKACFKKYI